MNYCPDPHRMRQEGRDAARYRRDYTSEHRDRMREGRWDRHSCDGEYARAYQREKDDMERREAEEAEDRRREEERREEARRHEARMEAYREEERMRQEEYERQCYEEQMQQDGSAHDDQP